MKLLLLFRIILAAPTITIGNAFTHDYVFQRKHHKRMKYRTPTDALFIKNNPSSSFLSQSMSMLSSKKDSIVKVGDILGDLPTPSLLIELSLAEGSIQSKSTKDRNGSTDPNTKKGHVKEDEFTNVLNHRILSHELLQGSIFIHTKVIDTSVRDAITKTQGSGKSYIICQVDAKDIHCGSSGAYLGIGLANHKEGNYYWARGMGMGASLPAHGIAFRPSSNPDTTDTITSTTTTSGGELYWKKRGPGRDATENTEESSNSNDGKRSEWADFLVVGDTVQLIPENLLEVLFTQSSSSLSSSHFQFLYGVRRIGRPLGADPIVEKIWFRNTIDNDDPSWVQC